MKKYLRLLTSTVALFLAVNTVSALEIGQKLSGHDLPLKSTDGKTTTLAKLKGKNGLLVAFTCNHCPYAKKWHDRLVKLGNEYSSATKGFGVVAINSNDPEIFPDDSLSNMKLLKEGKLPQSKLKMNFTYAMDETSNVARALGALKTPEFFLFNKKDELVYRGSLDGDADDPQTKDQFLKLALDKTLKNEKLTETEAKTEAFGCGIKFRKS
jgi:peroxiredoxin